MILLGNVLTLLVLAMILVLAIYAIIRGCKGIKESNGFEPTNRKIRISYLVLSILHMSAGILITVGYLVVGVLIIISL